MLHIAEKNAFVPPEAPKIIIDGLRYNPQVTFHRCLEDDHAFARLGGAHYNATSTLTAIERTLQLLNTSLC